jgi:hypothetical protein
VGIRGGRDGARATPLKIHAGCARHKGVTAYTIVMLTVSFYGIVWIAGIRASRSFRTPISPRSPSAPYPDSTPFLFRRRIVLSVFARGKNANWDGHEIGRRKQ